MRRIFLGLFAAVNAISQFLRDFVLDFLDIGPIAFLKRIIVGRLRDRETLRAV